MAFCSKCGAPLDENARFCEKCGAPAEPGAAGYGQTSAQQPKPEPKPNFITGTPDHTSEYDSEDVAKSKFMSVLAYIGPLVLIPTFVARNSEYTKFHVKQGLVLTVATYAYYTLVLNTILSITRAINGILTVIAAIPLHMAGLVFIALMVLGIIYAAKGKAKQLPVVGLCFGKSKE